MGLKIHYINHWEFLEDFSKDKALWGNGGIISNNTKGCGKIKYRYGIDDEDTINFFILKNDEPVLFGKDNGESTFVSLRSNLTTLKQEYTNLFRETSKITYENLKENSHLLYEFLNLFEPGVYLISQVQYSLLDSKYNFYWNLTSDLKEYNSLDFENLLAKENRLIPSQSSKKFNEFSVKKYRNKIKNNVNLQGIAYYLGGNTSVLLDGHLKSVASYIEGVPFSALTIIPIKDSVFDYLEDEEFILIGNRPISVKKLQKNTIKLINKYEKKRHLINHELLKKYSRYVDDIDSDGLLFNYILSSHTEYKNA